MRQMIFEKKRPGAKPGARFAALLGAAFAAFGSAPMQADPMHGVDVYRADGHAPMGVMGDHMHKTGEMMMSFRQMHMEMEGNRSGTSSLSAEEIVTSVPNVHFGKPMQPPTLRVVPQDMSMDMYMAGFMYAPSDWLTLTAMGMYVEKEMEALTFQGMTGTARLGTFTTRSSGFGDMKVAGLLRLDHSETRQVHLNLGLSLPTGSITEEDDVLTPMNTRPVMRLPYGMQLGSGTFDLEPGITYTDRQGDFSWGGQARATLRLGTNDEGYAFGDIGRLTGWAAYQWAPWISTSLRALGEVEGSIDGQDARIAGPTQAADPANYGGKRIMLSAGVNLIGQSDTLDGALAGHRLGIEFGLPAYQDLNGPQMERDWTLTIGWQKSF